MMQALSAQEEQKEEPKYKPYYSKILDEIVDSHCLTPGKSAMSGGRAAKCNEDL